MRTRSCTPATIAGRRAKALQFQTASETLALDDVLGDAYVTNCVHAGIAAADVICCARLGMHSVGQDHRDAVTLLSTAGADGPMLAAHLRTLLGLKTEAGYGASSVAAADRTRAGRAMDALMLAMQEAR